MIEEGGNGKERVASQIKISNAHSQDFRESQRKPNIPQEVTVTPHLSPKFLISDKFDVTDENQRKIYMCLLFFERSLADFRNQVVGDKEKPQEAWPKLGPGFAATRQGSATNQSGASLVDPLQ